MRKVIITLSAMILFVLQAIPQVYAASFDCVKANTAMEKTVCSDARLSAMDEELAKLYAATKAELSNRPEELRKLIHEQRDWLKSLKIGKCRVDVECLKFNYRISIREMRHRLNLARATQSTAVGPPKEAVMTRLTEQLTKLKELARSAKNVEITDARRGGKPSVCQYIWNNLRRAVVPIPTEYAVTGQQKRKMYARLRKMAYHNQRLFFEQGNSVEYPKKYKSTFNALWKKYSREFSEYDDSRSDAANLLFLQPDTRSGFKRFVFITILLDLDERGLSLDRYDQRADGLFNEDVNGYSNGAHSDEYHNDNLMDGEQGNVQGPMNLMGIMSLNNEIINWKAYKYPSINDKNWIVYVQPVHDSTNSKEISCHYDLDPDVKK